MDKSYTITYDEQTQFYTAKTNDDVICFSSYDKDDTIKVIEGLIDFVFRTGLFDDPS